MTVAKIFYWVITWKLLFSGGSVHWGGGIFLGGGEWANFLAGGGDFPHPPQVEMNKDVYIYCWKNIYSILFYSILCSKNLNNFGKFETLHNGSWNVWVENLKRHGYQISLSLSFTWYILYKVSKLPFVSLFVCLI